MKVRFVQIAVATLEEAHITGQRQRTCLYALDRSGRLWFRTNGEWKEVDRPEKGASK